MGHRHEMDLECQHVCYYWGSQYDEWQYDESMIQKACELLYPSITNTRHNWFYQLFLGWYNLGTNKFEYGFNLEGAWYNMTGEEIRQGFTLNNFHLEDQANLTLEEINERPCLKDDVTFALLIIVSPHTFVLLDELDDLPRLDVILNEKDVGLRNHPNQEHGSNIGGSGSKGGNRS
jgi:hypothetical protein